MLLRVSLIAAQALLTGCAASSIAQPVQPASASNIQSQSLLLQPSACDRGKRVAVGKNGGSFTLPRCAGWTGTISYPPRGSHNELRHWAITSSLTNNFGVPPPPSGAAIFYVQMYGGGSTFLESSATDTISSPTLNSNHTYSLMVYNFVFDDQCSGGTCPPWFANIGSPSSGSHTITFQSPLNEAVLGGAPLVWQFIQN